MKKTIIMPIVIVIILLLVSVIFFAYFYLGQKGVVLLNQHPNPQCNLRPNSGPCLADFPAYHYNNSTGKCEKFTWGGCKGTVPFETLQQCQLTCEK